MTTERQSGLAMMNIHYGRAIDIDVFMLGALGIMHANGGYVMRTAFRRVHHAYCWVVFKYVHHVLCSYFRSFQWV